ncbi:MAG: hypothetical protein Q8N10_03290 [Phenylobacterium sp.]|uniref:hypothetical protein n=1 Tax=Phenylobacterium sp. TaxID=1871053 RepID=UPI00271E20B0|nr:hypothetical protein [Phenylobacterium sp.]MDO8912294.1 hypothetical protein [Phenylobacterium sp.]MDP3099506.1 hypothetical protein [Phenylobacterium sp.]
MTDPMRVTRPIEISAASGLLTSTTVAEPSPDETAYDGGATYAKGDRAISTTLHWTWESASAGNSGNALPTAKAASNDYWLSVGPSNRWRMFDQLRDTVTTGASPLTIVVTPGQRVNALGLVKMIADQVEITATSVSGGGTVKSEIIGLQTRDVFGWLDFYTIPFEQVPSVVRYDIPMFSDAVITITLTRGGGDVSIGGLILGRYVDIGEVEVNPERDSQNFSTIGFNTWGDSVLTPRRTIPKTSQEVWTDKSRSRKLLRTLEELNAVPALWTGISDETDGNFEPLLIVGPYTRWTMRLNEAGQLVQQIDIREV